MPALIPTDDPDEESIMHLHIISRADAKRAGLKYYFTGKPCKYGHVALRYISSPCVECAFSEKSLAQRAEWKANNIENRREYNRAYHLKNKTKCNELSKARYYKNRERVLQRCRKYNQENKDKKRIAHIAYRMKNKEAIAKRSSEWSKNNRDKKTAYKNTRRARVAMTGGMHTPQDIQSILESQKFKCASCGCCIREYYEVDHIMPLALGGSSWPSNLQCLCMRCNRAKADRHPDEWERIKAAYIRWPRD